MRKLLVLTLAFSLFLFSCGKDAAQTTEITTENTTITVATEPSVGAETTFEDVKVETPTIAPDVDVKYEVLELDDEELQEIIDEKAAEILASYIPNISSISEMGGTAEYNVKLSRMYKSENIISAVFSGSYAIYYENSEEGGEVLYTVNVDRKSGKLLETPDIVDYEKMVEAFANGNFDVSPDFSQYNSAYGIYPYVAIENVGEEIRLGVYVTRSGMYEEVLGYYISLDAAKDFLKIGE